MKLSVWYHCVLSGERIVDPGHARNVLREQMAALVDSGLYREANEFHLGINGPDADACEALSLAPDDLELHVHHQGQSELTTLACLQRSLRPGWLVCYHHIKGVQYPNQPVWERWRRCMQQHVITQWRNCVMDLTGPHRIETVGAHWMNHKQFYMVPQGQRYWGGNFWWATSDYLLTLPTVAADSHHLRYEAETWIGSGFREPVHIDYAPHFPMRCPAQ